MPRERKVPARLRDSANLDEIEAAEEENGNSISSNSPKKARKDSNSSSDLASPMENRVTALTMATTQQVTDHIPSHMLHGQNMHVLDNNRYQGVTAIVYPCGICKRNVDDNDDAILCETGCGLWYHRVCTGLTELAYNLLTSEDNAEWVCNACIASKTIPLVKLKS